jgi:hypothetical protein
VTSIRPPPTSTTTERGAAPNASDTAPSEVRAVASSPDRSVPTIDPVDVASVSAPAVWSTRTEPAPVCASTGPATPLTRTSPVSVRTRTPTRSGTWTTSSVAQYATGLGHSAVTRSSSSATSNRTSGGRP